MSSNNGFSLQSKSLSRAMSFNKEQERRLSLEEAELSDGRQKIRFNINSKMHQLRSDIFKVRVKTPSLEECFEGKTLSGLDSNPNDTQSSVSAFYEINGNGRLVKKSPAKNTVSAGKSKRTSRQKAKGISIPSTAEIQDKISSFFERNKELFTPAHGQSEAELEWSRGTRSSQSYFREAEPSVQDNRPRTAALVTNVKLEKDEVKPSPQSQPTSQENLSDMLHSAWQGSTSVNPYQSFFKPETSTLRFAQQMAVVSRKLKNIQMKRELMIVERVQKKAKAAQKNEQQKKQMEMKKISRKITSFKKKIETDDEDE